MKIVHRYPSDHKFFFWFYSLLAYFFIVMGLFVGFGAIFTMKIDQVFVGLGAIIVGLFQLFYAHFYSGIITDDEGLLVQFCFWHLRVRWDDVINMQLTTKDLLMNTIAYSSAHYVVETRALTPFHRFYGLYLSSFQPSFIFHSSISGLDDLRSSIKNKKTNPKSEKLVV